MFGAIHLPAEDITSCVVMCSSTHAELLKSYQLEVALARALAAEGIAVQRFHYRGDGNSEGDIEELTLQTMMAGAGEVRDRLVERTGNDRVAFVGVRLGGFPAAVLAGETSGARLVLWDPVLDADRFMREALRSHAIAALKGEGKPERTEQTLERLSRDGSIDLLGYEFTAAFYESIKGWKLADHPPRGGKALVVPFGTTNAASLIDAWTADNVEISIHEGTEGEAWWLDEQATRDRQSRGIALASLTAKWLQANSDD